MVRQRFPRATIALFFSARACLGLHPHGQYLRADILRQPETTAALQHRFSAEDERLLDEVQRGCFNFLWKEVGDPAALVKDRKGAEISSVAAVGFQLSALPIGVERGWVSREAALKRAERVLTSLINGRDNKKFGIYLHFVDRHTAGHDPGAPQVQASTVDHALLQAGAIPAAVYFGGRVAELTDQLIEAANWAKYINTERHLISFGWRPEDPANMNGAGAFRPWMWQWASAEEQLVYLLAVGSPSEQHRVPPEAYYRLERRVMQQEGFPEFAASWNGALFTYFFSQCWINYSQFEADRPGEFGFEAPRVDWFENSRRAVLAHRARCIEMADQFATFGPDRWGLSPSNGFRANGDTTYFVPSVRPNIADEENWCEGTLTPYAAGTSIMFTPAESMRALREFRALCDEDWAGWDDPSEGGDGLPDSFNVDQQKANHDTLGIDVGPMLLGIENARTGLIWRLFHEHPTVERAVQLLKWERLGGERPQ